MHRISAPKRTNIGIKEIKEGEAIMRWGNNKVKKVIKPGLMTKS